MLVATHIYFALSSLLAAGPPTRIDGLEEPRVTAPRPPPSDNDEAQLEEDLEKKRSDRHVRDNEGRPPPIPFAKKREINLLKDALAPHQRWMLLEISAVFGLASTRAPKDTYAVDPASHFNLIFRHDPTHKDGKVGLWYGLRIAPFVGTGFYKNKPGRYGLTYFGPMIGVGKIDPVVQDSSGSKDAKGDVEIPSAKGWVMTAGVAAVSKAGHYEDGEGTKDRGDDFSSKGVAFDAPGIWSEARFFYVAYGALGLDAFAGIQFGSTKRFIYGGIGVGAWY